MKAAIVIQARMGSTRLPGKVLLPLAGQPMLAQLVHRLRRVARADAIVVATTTHVADDAIAQWCNASGTACYRGSALDVLSRYAMAAREHQADVVVRITSDCPLMDPALVDEMLELFAPSTCDYLSNTQPPTWPYGMAVEVFSATALYQAERSAVLPDEREHVTPHIYWHPEIFRLQNVTYAQDLTRYRWTVDTPEDYALVKLLYEAAHQVNPDFEWTDVLTVQNAHPEWMAINQNVEQKKLRPAMQTHT